METVYAWGYGDILSEILKGVKFVVGSDTFADAWKAVLALTLTIMAVYSSILSRNGTDYLKLPAAWVLTGLVWTLFVVARVDVYVDDRSNPNNHATITNVPWAVGYPLAKFSQLEKTMGEVMETMFSVPNEISYSESGFAAGVSIFQNASSHRVHDPNLERSIEEYMIECVMPDIETGYKSYDDLIQSDELWQYLGDTNPSIFLYITNDDGVKEMVTCDNAYTSITDRMNNYITNEALPNLDKFYGSSTLGVMQQRLGIANSYYLDSAKTAQNRMMQFISLNHFHKAHDTYTTNLASAQAQRIAETNMQTQAGLAGKYLPVFKGILTTVIIGLTPILALVMITPIGMTAAKGYLFSLAWLSMWHMGDVLLNFIINVKASSSIVQMADGSYSFSTKGLIDSSMIDYISMAGSMYWMIPTIAGIIIGGFSWIAIQSLGQQMSGVPQQAGHVASSSTALGNISAGNANYSNLGANQMSSKLYNTVGNATSVGQSYELSQNASSNQNFNQSSYDGFGGSMQGFSTDMRNTMSDIMGAGSHNIGQLGSAQVGALSTQAIGDGKQQVNQTSIVADSNGNQVTANSGSVFKSTEDGGFVPYTGEFEFASKNDNGTVDTVTANYQNGRVVSGSGIDGDTGANFTFSGQGQDMRTTISYGDGNSYTLQGDQVVGANINGISLSKEDLATYSQSLQQQQSYEQAKSFIESEGTKEVDSETKSALTAKTFEIANSDNYKDSEVSTYAQNLTKNSLLEFAESQSETRTDGISGERYNTESHNSTLKGDVSASISSDGQVLGWLAEKAFGAKAEAGVSYSLSSVDNDGFTVRKSTGETASYSFNEQEREQYSDVLSNNIAASKAQEYSETQSSRNSDSVNEQFSNQLLNEISQTAQNSEGYKDSEVYSKVESMSENDRVQFNETVGYMQKAIEQKEFNEGYADVLHRAVNPSSYTDASTVGGLQAPQYHVEGTVDSANIKNTVQDTNDAIDNNKVSPSTTGLYDSIAKEHQESVDQTQQNHRIVKDHLDRDRGVEEIREAEDFQLKTPGEEKMEAIKEKIEPFTRGYSADGNIYKDGEKVGEWSRKGDGPGQQPEYAQPQDMPLSKDAQSAETLTSLLDVKKPENNNQSPAQNPENESKSSTSDEKKPIVP